MFTGLIECTGNVVKISRVSIDYALHVEVSDDFIKDVKQGDSIALDGLCLTVEEIKKNVIRFYVLSKSAEKSIIPFYKSGVNVNLEKAMRSDGRFGGHFVNGHVDCCGEITEFRKNRNSRHIEIEILQKYGKYLVENDSVSVNGISLTIKSAFGSGFALEIIPETVERTNIENWNIGRRVNIEINHITKSVYTFINRS